MKQVIYLITLTLVLVSCGSRSGYFKFEGRLLNLNQGEFYVYSPDGVFDGLDTIKVDGGRFTYETPCKENGTIVIVFPNYSEQPVFAEPGKSVTIKGDASHLKEIEMEGTDENELMNGFRKQVAKASPPEMIGYAEQFIKNNPESAASVYILEKYFIRDAKMDVKKAQTLADIIYKAQPKNGNMARLIRFISMKKSSGEGSVIPSFTAQDINGKLVTEKDLRGKVSVVYAWADWDYDSRNLHNKLSSLKKEYGNRLSVLGIYLDGDKGRCRNALRGDSVLTMEVCDKQMFDSPLMDKFSFSYISDNVIFNAHGKAIERNLKTHEFEAKLKALLN